MSLLDGLLRHALLGTSAAVLCLFSLGFVQTRAAETNTLVLPPEAADAEGGSFGGPFYNSVDYQIAYDGSLFTEVSGSIEITGIAWRADGEVSAGSTEILVPRLEIWASTFQNPLSELSEIREENWGSDRVNVFMGDNITVSSSLGSAPNNFDINIDFQTPFTYNPESGPLLLDISSSGGLTGGIWIDVGGSPGFVAMMLDDATGPDIVMRADVLQVSYIPEPRIMAIMTPSLLVFLLIKRRSR